MARDRERTLYDGEALLPPALRRVSSNIDDPAERRRFTGFFAAAAAAINALGELELSRYEIEDLGKLDTGLWNVLSPVVGETLNSVNRFLEIVRTLFPIAIRCTVENDTELPFERAFDRIVQSHSGHPAAAKRGAEVALKQRVQEVAALLQRICDTLAREVTRFGEGLRTPTLLSDRWQLLDHLGEFRGRFRSGIGEMVFLAAAVFDDVSRDEVIPYYREDVDNSVLVRQGLVLLRDKLHLMRAKVHREKHVAALRVWLKALLKELEAFLASVSYAHLRAADKRPFISFKKEIQRLMDETDLYPRDVERTVEGLTRFLDSLSVINRRELLIIDDRLSLQRAKRAIEDAQQATLDWRREQACAELQQAIRMATRLLGRDRGLDDRLRLLAKVSVAELDLVELSSATEVLGTALEAVEERC